MIRPLGKNILIKPDSAEDKTKSGIIIPEHANNPLYLTGTVEAVGTRVDMDVKKGDHVAFQKIYSEIKDTDGDKYLVEEVFLLAIYE